MTNLCKVKFGQNCCVRFGGLRCCLNSAEGERGRMKERQKEILKERIREGSKGGKTEKKMVLKLKRKVSKGYFPAKKQTNPYNNYVKCQFAKTDEFFKSYFYSALQVKAIMFCI